MVRDFHIAKEEDIGYYIGFITASFALSQLLTGKSERRCVYGRTHRTACIHTVNKCFMIGIHWGILSDRIGRRPVILCGMIGTIISITLFGLSKSYLWALLSRSLCGLLVSLKVHSRCSNPLAYLPPTLFFFIICVCSFVYWRLEWQCECAQINGGGTYTFCTP